MPSDQLTDQLFSWLLDGQVDAFWQHASAAGQPWPLRERLSFLLPLLLYSCLFWLLCLPVCHLASTLLSSTYRAYPSLGRRAPWLSYCLSMVHSPLSAGLSIWSVLSVDWSAAAAEPALRYWFRSPLIVFTIMVTLGYMLVDLAVVLACLRHFRDPSVLIFHHVLIFVTYGGGLVTERLFGLWFMLTFQTQEFSNPFMAMRWFLLELGMKDGRLFAANNLIFAATFTVGRMIFGNYFAYLYFVSAPLSSLFFDVPMVAFSISVLFFQGIQCFWFYKIVDTVIRQFRRHSKTP